MNRMKRVGMVGKAGSGIEAGTRKGEIGMTVNGEGMGSSENVLRSLVIHRTDVEAMNLVPYLERLMAMYKDKDLVLSCRQRIKPSICGYGLDRRALYQIPEVRDFLRRLDSQFPYWFYFVDPACGFLPVLLKSLCPLMAVLFNKDSSRVRTIFNKTDAWAFMDRGFGAMKEMIELFHPDHEEEEINKLMTSEVLRALKLPMPPPLGSPERLGMCGGEEEQQGDNMKGGGE